MCQARQIKESKAVTSNPFVFLFQVPSSLKNKMEVKQFLDPGSICSRLALLAFIESADSYGWIKFYQQ